MNLNKISESTVGSVSAFIAYMVILVLNIFSYPERVYGQPKTTALTVLSVIFVGYVIGGTFSKFNSYSNGEKFSE